MERTGDNEQSELLIETDVRTRVCRPARHITEAGVHAERQNSGEMGTGTGTVMPEKRVKMRIRTR